MNGPIFPYPATLDGYQNLFGGCSVGEKVRLQTGNLVRQMNLIRVSTIGPALSFELTYNSQSASENHGFGHGWVHDWQAKITPSATNPVYTDQTGRPFTFELDGSDWVLDLANSMFDQIELTSLPGDEWRISYYPDGEILDFDSDGRLIRRVDRRGNGVALAYNLGGQLIEIQEDVIGVSSGRKIQLTYGSDTITVTDPESHDYVLVFSSTNDNLVQVVGPEGCVTTFDYADPTDHLITGRTDPVARDPEEMPPVAQAWSYTFGDEGQLLSVTDSRGVEVSYEYVDSYEEYIGGPGSAEPQTKSGFGLTLVTVPPANPGDDPSVWRYVFDPEGTLRRIIDPNYHQRRFIWGPQGQLVYEASGYLNWDPALFNDPACNAPSGSRPGPHDLGIRDQAGMRFRTSVYNTRGSLLQSSDGNGVVTHFEYEDDRLVAVTPGRANSSVQGEWESHFGKEGFYLCGVTGSADMDSLPAYISALTPGSGTVAPRNFAYTEAYPKIDPRNLRYRQGDALLKAQGCWKSSLDGSAVPYRRFQFTLEMASETNFNLSLYTNAVDLGMWYSGDIRYEEQSGYELEFLVTDSVGTQRYRIACNQNGIWTTFPVQPGSGNVLVEVRARGNNNSTDNLNPIGDAVLSAIAFDAYDNRTTRMTYNSFGQVTTVTDPLGNTSEFEYNLDGTLASTLESGAAAATVFEYGDVYKNLTKITDPLEGEVNLTYDLNGNLRTVLDADSRLTRLFYDAKNRLVQVRDALNFETAWTYDAGGRVVEVEDAKGRKTQVAYKHQRVWKVTDAAGQIMTMDYTDAGFPLSVTDRRGKTTSVVYDAANQVTLVEFPDCAKVRYALDSLGRIAAMTPPNGNQDDPEEMNLEGAKNILFNPLAEELRPYDPNALGASGALAPRYWEGGLRAVDAEGRAYLPLKTGEVTEWTQYDTPMSAGGRYVSSFLARKTDGTSGSTTARLEFIHRLHKDYPDEYHRKFADTIESTSFAPTSTNWEESPRDLVEIPGDIQFSWLKPALAQTTVKRDSGSAPLGVKNMQLQRLSVCMEYDGENLREICLPDGARQRVEYDVFGRPFLSTDPNGRTLLREYDNLDRVTHVIDSLGNELFFEYNERSDMTLFRLRSQGVNQDTIFDWDDLHRLEQITYPDETTEVFTYTAAGDLASYTDNAGVSRSFSYDALHRLKTITYADTSTVALSYDSVGNLIKVVERNGDEWSYGYDQLNRLRLQVFSSGGVQTGFTYRYNENGQRMALGTPAIYGSTEYGEATGDIWTVPSVGGRDEVGRLLQVEDADSNLTTMAYDVDGRCTQLSHPNSVSDLFGYDIVGKLMNVTVEKDSSTLLKLAYSYNLGQDRIGLNTDQDTFVYLTDDAGRLVEECHNRFCIDHERVWKQGVWDCVTLENGELKLLELEDDFAGDLFHAQRWTLTTRRHSDYSYGPTRELNNVGLEVRQNQGLHIAYPRAYTNCTGAHEPVVHNYVGQDSFLGWRYSPDYRPGGLDWVPAQEFYVELRHAEKLVGDFDVAVDYEGLQSHSVNYHLRLGICLGYPVEGNTFYSVDLNGVGQVSGRTWPGGGGYWDGLHLQGATGQLRLKRVGSTLEAFHRDSDLDSWASYGTRGGPSAPVYLYLGSDFNDGRNAVDITVKNFRHLDGKTHAAQGRFESPIYDAGHVVSWDRLQWVENNPVGCDVELEVRVADDWAEFENFASHRSGLEPMVRAASSRPHRARTCPARSPDATRKSAPR